MKRYLVFYLIFFLVFIIQIKFVEGLSTSQCRYYNLMDGSCLFGTGYFWTEIIEAPLEEGLPEAPPAIFVKLSPTDAFFSLTTQFFLIVLLTVILVILLESLLEPH
jgi:hypothetical protein